MSRMNKNCLDFYTEHVEGVILPFWHRAVDTKYGGIFTCFSNNGNTLLSRDKYTWSQGRFLWLWSRLASMAGKNQIAGNQEEYLSQADQTASFLFENVFLENGNCAFVLDEEGKMKESHPGRGYDTSFYADCFIVLGLTEYIRASKRTTFISTILSLFDSIIERLDNGKIRSEPYPIPDGYRSHSVSMIMLNVTQEVAEVLESFNHPRMQEFVDKSLFYMNDIIDHFMMADGRIIELLPNNPSRKRDTLLARHVNPGHAVECMWFVMKTAERAGNLDVINRAVQTIKWAFAIGWDKEYGGLLRFADHLGGEPNGRLIDDPYEKLIQDTWDTKLWWPHSEILYAALLGYSLTQDSELISIYEQMEKYVFDTFPNTNLEIGEWIQIRARNGEPINKTVALPVKDPYHILRNLLLIIELLHEKPALLGQLK
ncbi:AGE family epimerase/isomerase [Mesobacillus harenae]|uniref:AGE family epimerase/isomerase n=1 Tax=Mesobacillus harenae TaxID=2213203 RepID=UPI00157FE9B4|nr:AGE family epimerase/isomerase [Mesobacillus harenae]